METGQKERLWLICELYYPEVNATGHYITQIGTGLADEFDVRVICGQPNYLSKGIRAPARGEYRGVKIRRVWSTTLNKNIVVFRIINMITIGASMFIRCIRDFRRGDKVLVVTAPPSLPYTTPAAALAKGASYIVLLHDLYPDILVAVGKTKAHSIFVRVIDRINRWLYKHANRLVVVGRDMRRLVSNKAEGLDVPIVFIPNWSDLDAIEPYEKTQNRLLRELGIQDKFVLMYAGNIGHPTDIETIVSAAEILRNDDRIHFVFVGSGAKHGWLEQETARRKLDNISILGQLPRDRQNEFLNACDVGLVSLVRGMLGTAMPSRTYNILAAGKPVIALTDDGSELAMVIDEEKVGWHTRPGEPEALVSLIRVAQNDQDIIAEMGKRSRAAAEREYSPEKAVARYRSLISEV